MPACKHTQLLTFGMQSKKEKTVVNEGVGTTSGIFSVCVFCGCGCGCKAVRERERVTYSCKKVNCRRQPKMTDLVLVSE